MDSKTKLDEQARAARQNISVNGGGATKTRFAKTTAGTGSGGLNGWQRRRGWTLMPKRSTFNPDAPLQSINHTSYIIGESRSAIRAGIKAGRIPHCVRGSGSNAMYLVNVPHYLAMIDEESKANLRSEVES